MVFNQKQMEDLNKAGNLPLGTYLETYTYKGETFVVIDNTDDKHISSFPIKFQELVKKYSQH